MTSLVRPWMAGKAPQTHIAPPPLRLNFIDLSSYAAATDRRSPTNEPAIIPLASEFGFSVKNASVEPMQNVSVQETCGSDHVEAIIVCV